MARPEGWALTLLVVMVLILMWVKWRWPSPATPRAHPKPTPRPLKPRTPDDCPACRAAQPSPPPASTPLKPYSPVKDPRGPLREKRIATAGYACPNSDRLYFGITDDQIHALVGCGGHGRQEYIQDFYCQACHRKFSTQRHTPLYRLRTPAARVTQVLYGVAEGLSAQTAARVFQISETTIRSWISRAGQHSQSLHDRLMRALQLTHVQLDELRLKLRGVAAAARLWVACDARTTLIPAFTLGPRTQAQAHRRVHELAQRLTPGYLPVFSSDGLAL